MNLDFLCYSFLDLQNLFIMKKTVIGIVAHVDAGKTTLSEALLYKSGSIRTLGRVDNKNTFLDSNSIERNRGITIFSKQAQISKNLTLIDTPGHIDFGAEMERTLSVLDLAILLINACDGIQAHTKTLWSLLQKQKIPTLIFVNKMDRPDTNKENLLSSIKKSLSENIIPFNPTNSNDVFEEIASCDENLIEKFLTNGTLEKDDIYNAILSSKFFPCMFGSALKLQDIDNLSLFLNEFSEFRNKISNLSSENHDFGAIVYKINYDKQNNRLTHLKITNGKLKVKDILEDEKINEIRIYSGEKYETTMEVEEGCICTVTGLKNSKAGKTYGICNQKISQEIEPSLIYSVIPPTEIDITRMLKILRELEEELPEIKVHFNTSTEEICMMLMGEIQTEVITQLLKDRYGITILFGESRIAYKETLSSSVNGVGHYEPLKHYAEVHLQLIPVELGSGLKYSCNLSVDVLDKNWQRLILTHLQEKTHLGVLTGSPITDLEIKVTAGKDHLKHTEGGDFRQATYRAVRQALMYAKKDGLIKILEPFYYYEIVVPDTCTGRVMSDMDKMCGTCNLQENKGGFSILTGKAPVSTMKSYMNEIRAFSKGQGTLTLLPAGYDLCHNQKEVVTQINYNPDNDFENPSFSVFCSHGAGFAVPWDKVNEYKHL